MIKNRFTLQNKIILITGASGKLANDFIKDFINNDAIVIGIDIKDHAPMFDELNDKLKTNFFYYKTDISNKKELSKIFEDLKLKKLLPNTLINNAAAGQVTFLNGSLVEFTEFPHEVWDENLKVKRLVL